jgi:hypothetical protein
MLSKQVPERTISSCEERSNGESHNTTSCQHDPLPSSIVVAACGVGRTMLKRERPRMAGINIGAAAVCALQLVSLPALRPPARRAVTRLPPATLPFSFV